jgi:TonB-dependent starch-binding outer membrane protein SusC
MKTFKLLQRTTLFRKKSFMIMKLSLFFLAVTIFNVFGQETRITGIVTDSNNETLPGVSVVVTGTTTGTLTDVNGSYSIMVPRGSETLTFSFVGMERQIVRIGTSVQINVIMSSSIIDLDEIVVVGYGTQRRSDLTGSVVRVNSEDLVSRPTNNVLEAMQGRAAGVDITTSERPGTIGSIRIRGVRSITASNAPLYVVDGVPVMSASGIETMNPADIESIDILKDASATAIYGSRGANGVVLVTTKRGESGQFTLNYSGSAISESMVWRSEFMNAQEFIEFVRWGSHNFNPVTFSPGDQPSMENDAKIGLFTADPTAWNNIQSGWAGGTWDASKLQKYDWMNEVTQPNFTQNHTLSGSGGTESMRAYASFGYLDNQGTTKGQEYQRYTFRTNVEITPNKWFKIGANMNSTLMNQDYGQANIGASMSSASSLINTTARIYPYALPYDSEGQLIAFPGGQSRVSTVIDEWKYSTNQRETLRLMATMFAEVRIMDGLRYRMNFGPDYRNYRNGIYNDGQSVIRGGSSYASYSGNVNFSWTVDNLLYYDKSFGKHSVGATLLQTASSWVQKSDNMSAQGIGLASQQWYALGEMSALDNWGTGLTERQLASYMGRFNYNFNNRYLLTVSGRWDGASQLADGNKWAFFPSAALAWRLDQEDFMKDITFISQLKLRLGYGVVGNSAVNPYSTKGGIASRQTPFGSDIINVFTTSNSLSNKGLGWEKTEQYNLGLDFSVYRGRISGVIDAYTSHTKDLLLNMTLLSVTGYSSSLANIGETRNKGVDISINSFNIRNRDFVWNSRVSAAWQKDEIVSLMHGKEDMVGNTWFIGNSINVRYNYERLGLWQDTPDDLDEMAKFNANGHKFQPGMVRVKDQNGDYRITANDDRVILGNSNPRWTAGLNNSFNYKSWDLSVFINGRMKYLRPVGEGLTGMFGDQRVLDYWTPNNTNAEYQKPFRNEAGGDTYSGSYFKDDSYLKIQNISLGYRLPQATVTRIGVRNLRVYVQSTNPGMLWSNNKFLDPEYGTLHYNRAFVFGVDVGF